MRVQLLTALPVEVSDAMPDEGGAVAESQVKKIRVNDGWVWW